MLVNVVGNGAAAIAMVLRLIKETNFQVTWWGGLSIKNEIEGKAVLEAPYGIAYRTSQAEHRLNAPAKTMSLDIEGTESFPQYLRKHHWMVQGNSFEECFPQRMVYRQYLRQQLMDNATLLMRRVSFQPRAQDPYQLRGAPTVLCCGAVHQTANIQTTCIQDPWSFDYARVLNATNVVVLGSGLTALDTAISIWSVNPGCHITFISRSGRFPLLPGARGVKDINGVTSDWTFEHPHSVRLMLREMRQTVKNGVFWGDLMNHLRNKWSQLWNGLSDAEKNRFLRHVRPFWEIHRHKMIPETRMILSDHAWKIKRLRDVQYEFQDAEFVFNATGVNTNASANPLIAKLLSSKVVSIPPGRGASYGLAGDENCKVGMRMWCVGAYMRWNRWESTAMSDIVAMTKIVARQLKQECA